MNEEKRGRSGESDESTEAQAGPKQVDFVLRLYIAGMSLRSSRAVDNIKKICEEHPKGATSLK